jgi:hypothetical protein
MSSDWISKLYEDQQPAKQSIVAHNKRSGNFFIRGVRIQELKQFK